MLRALEERGLFAVLLLVATITLLTLRFFTPPTRLVDLGAPGDAYLVANFYQPEQAASLTYRWSGPNSRFEIPALASQAVVLGLRLHGNMAGQQVYLQAADALAPIAALSAGQDWRVYHVLLPPSREGGSAPRAVQLITSLAQPGASDPRELGVAVDWVRLQPLVGCEALPGALGQAAMVGWALALIGGILWIALRAWVPAALPRAQRRRGLLLLGVVAAGLGLWAWLDPYTLRWLLPLQAGPLALATVALAGLGWRHRLSRPLAWPLWTGRGEVLGLAALLALAHALLWSPLPAPARGAAALLILWLPGWLLARRFSADELAGAARLLLGVCGALGFQIVLLLAASLLPAGLAPWGLLLASDLVALLLGVWMWRAPAVPAPTPGEGPHPGMLLALALALAAGLRLPFLGSAELHDDEASVLIAAAQLAHGRVDALLTQLKGPTQILLAAGPLALTGQITEQVSRLSFALAGLGVVLGGFVLMRRMSGGSIVAGLIAALILALDGFMIAFSRIVQYQSVVIVMVLGTMWLCWQFYEGAPRARRTLTGAALLYALALLGHYDAIFAAPALAWLVLAGGWRRRWDPGAWVSALAWPAIAGGALLASFYVPFVLHPHFGEAIKHLSERTGQTQGGWSLYNNLASTYGLLTFYNLADATHLIGALLLGGLAVAVVRVVHPRWLGWLLLLPLVAAAGVDLLRGPDHALLLSDSPVAVVVWALPVAALILAPATPAALRALLLWCGAGGLATLFLIAQPRTHVYVATVPAALLAGWSAAALIAWLRGTRLRRLGVPLIAGLLLVVLLATLHQATLYVRQTPEYQRAYPATQLGPIDRSSGGTPINVDARFGFPSRDGWKAVGELYRRGVLRGPYASNQSTEILAWYLRGLRRCGAEPALHLIALSGPGAPIPQGYYRTITVQVDGQDRIGIYARTPPGGPPQIVDLATYVAPFDEQPIPALPMADEACRS